MSTYHSVLNELELLKDCAVVAHEGALLLGQLFTVNMKHGLYLIEVESVFEDPQAVEAEEYDLKINKVLYQTEEDAVIFTAKHTTWAKWGVSK